jgi:oligoendopeptidase F
MCVYQLFHEAFERAVASTPSPHSLTAYIHIYIYLYIYTYMCVYQLFHEAFERAVAKTPSPHSMTALVTALLDTTGAVLNRALIGP